jgi:folate-dependent phosphoribosylglycinamide formyltransferase PurN
MRVVIATQEEPFYLPRIFDTFLTGTRATCPAAIIADPLVTLDGLRRTAKQHWSLYGPLWFMRQGIRFAALKVQDRLGMARERPRSVRAVMNRHRIPIWRLPTINAPDVQARLADLGADILLSIAYPEIIRDAVLGSFPHGGINFHCGPLPHYRGANPLFWCMLRGESQSAVTIHRMRAKVDAGPILAQQFFRLDDLDSLDAAYGRAIEIGAPLLEKVLLAIASGHIEERDNPIERGSYFGFPSAADGRAFRKAGKKYW